MEESGLASAKANSRVSAGSGGQLVTAALFACLVLCQTGQSLAASQRTKSQPTAQATGLLQAADEEIEKIVEGQPVVIKSRRVTPQAPAPAHPPQTAATVALSPREGLRSIETPRFQFGLTAEIWRPEGEVDVAQLPSYDLGKAAGQTVMPRLYGRMQLAPSAVVSTTNGWVDQLFAGVGVGYTQQRYAVAAAATDLQARLHSLALEAAMTAVNQVGATPWSFSLTAGVVRLETVQTGDSSALLNQSSNLLAAIGRAEVAYRVWREIDLVLGREQRLVLSRSVASSAVSPGSFQMGVRLMTE